MSFDLEDESSVDCWEQVFSLLSVDKVYEFWSEMGLPVEFTPAVIAIAQYYMQEAHLIIKDASLSRDDALDKTRTLFREVFNRLTSEFNAEVASAFYKWGISGFYHCCKEWPELFAWNMIFRRLTRGKRDRHSSFIPLELPRRKLRLLKTMARKYFLSTDIFDRLEEIEQSPKTDWEVHLTNLWRSNLNDDTITYDSTDDVVPQLIFVNAKILWQEIRKVLSLEELEVLADWGRKQGRAMDMRTDNLKLPIVLSRILSNNSI